MPHTMHIYLNTLVHRPYAHKAPMAVALAAFISTLYICSWYARVQFIANILLARHINTGSYFIVNID